MARKTIHDRLVDGLIAGGAELLPKRNRYTMFKHGALYYFVGRAGALRVASRANMAISKPVPEGHPAGNPRRCDIEHKPRVGTRMSNKILSRVPPGIVENRIARICGVLPTDTRVEVAEKIIAAMRSAGFEPRLIDQAERALVEYKARMN